MVKKCFLMAVVAVALAAASVNGATRGIRNNNLGNIIKTDTTWQGEVACSDTQFECFESPAYGLRAMALILYHYHLVYLDDSLYDVLYRWMPPSENPTEAILLNIKGVVCKDNRKIYLVDMIYLIVFIENGSFPVTYDDIRSALPNPAYERVYFYCDQVTT